MLVSSFSFGFWIFDFSVSVFLGASWIYRFMYFLKFREFSTINSSKYSLYPFIYLSFPSETHVICRVVLLMKSLKFFSLCLPFFILFFLFASHTQLFQTTSQVVDSSLCLLVSTVESLLWMFQFSYTIFLIQEFWFGFLFIISVVLLIFSFCSYIVFLIFIIPCPSFPSGLSA